VTTFLKLGYFLAKNSITSRNTYFLFNFFPFQMHFKIRQKALKSSKLELFCRKTRLLFTFLRQLWDKYWIVFTNESSVLLYPEYDSELLFYSLSINRIWNAFEVSIEIYFEFNLIKWENALRMKSHIRFEDRTPRNLTLDVFFVFCFWKP